MEPRAARVRGMALVLFAVVLGCICQTSVATYPHPSNCRGKCGNNCCPGEECIRNSYGYTCEYRSTQCQACGVLKHGSCTADSSKCPPGQKCSHVAKNDSFQCYNVSCGACGVFKNGACVGSPGKCPASSTCQKSNDGKFDCKVVNVDCGICGELKNGECMAIPRGNPLDQGQCPLDYICEMDNDGKFNCFLALLYCGDCGVRKLGKCYRDETINCPPGKPACIFESPNYYNCGAEVDCGSCGVFKDGECVANPAGTVGLGPKECPLDTRCAMNSNGKFECENMLLWCGECGEGKTGTCKPVDSKCSSGHVCKAEAGCTSLSLQCLYNCVST
jgi:hypothetical protein